MTLEDYKSIFIALRDAYAIASTPMQRRFLLNKGTKLNNAAIRAGIGEVCRNWAASTLEAR